MCTPHHANKRKNDYIALFSHHRTIPKVMSRIGGVSHSWGVDLFSGTISHALSEAYFIFKLLQSHYDMKFSPLSILLRHNVWENLSFLNASSQYLSLREFHKAPGCLPHLPGTGLRPFGVAGRKHLGQPPTAQELRFCCLPPACWGVWLTKCCHSMRTGLQDQEGGRHGGNSSTGCSQ